MKKRFLTLIFTITAMLLCIFGLSACGKVASKVNFVVDGEVYATLNTKGEEVIKMPENPTKDDYVFDGWYWDKDTWKIPFTANSLLDAPLSSDMSVYCKWKPKQEESGDETKGEETNTGLSFKTLTVDGTNVSGKVSNTTETFSFLEEVSAYGLSKFIVALDIYGAQQVVTKTIALNVGDNTAYVIETIDGEAVKVYTVTVRRRPMYTVSFDSNGGTAVQSQQVEEDSCARVPETTPERLGYTFKKWDYDFSNPILKDETISANWTIKTYTISYELSGGDNAESNPTTYTIEDNITLSAPIKTGYTGSWDNGGKIETGSTGNKVFTAIWSADVTLSADGKTVTGLKNNVNNLIILNEYNGIKVTSIGSSAFRDCSSLTSVTIPDSVTSIGKYAFNYCYKLIEVKNLSTLDITAGSSSYGYVGYYAKRVYKAGESYLSTDENGYIVYDDGTDKILMGYTGTQTDLTLPNDITQINQYAFYGCYSLTSVTIPDSVTSIGDRAFNGCSSLQHNVKEHIKYLGNTKNPYVVVMGVTDTTLTSCVIDNNAKIIYNYAFSGCSRLTSITIPDSVTSIGSEAFSCCDSLTSVYITDIAAWCKISFHDYSANPLNYAHNLYLNNELVTELIIPDGVTSIGSYAFSGCSRLTSVTIPDSVTSIGRYAFEDCRSLTSVYITDIAAWCKISFGDYANPLDNAHNLYLNNELVTELTIPNSVTSIGDWAFYDCSSLTSVTISDSVTSIGDWAFYDCSSLTSIAIPNSVTSIGRYAFYNCRSLTSVTIGNSVTSIGNGAFSNCSSLTSVTIPDSVTSIGDWAFYDCSSLTSIAIPNSVTSIGRYAFEYCSSLTSVTIGNSVTSIGNDAFNYCYKLIEVKNLSTLGITAGSSDYGYVGYYAKRVYKERESYLSTDENGYIIYDDGTDKILVSYTGTETDLTLPSGITQINQYAFYNCSNLTSITIPDSVMSIGDCTFQSCSSLTSVTIPDSVTSIGWHAFSNCSSLTSVTIPDSVTSIGSYAFRYCSSLTSVTIGNSVTSIGSYAFYNCSSLTGVYITDIAAWCKISFSDYYSNPLYYAHNLYLNNELVTELTIPNSVTSIGSYAFEDCSSLRSVTIPDSVTSIGSYAFEDCSSLTSVTIPDSVTSIGYGTFMNCSSLRYNIKNNIKYLGNTKNPYVVVMGVTNTTLTTYTIDNNAKIIYYYAFEDCSRLTSVTIGNSVTSIGSSVFSGCSSLTSITVDENNQTYKSIDGNLYTKDGTNLIKYAIGKRATTFSIPDSVTSIGSSAFSGCSRLTSVTIPDSVTSIGSYAFYNCSSLTSVTIPDSVTSIGDGAFEYCSSLTSVYITDIAAWCKISFSNSYANPLYYAHNLYLNNELVTELIIPDGVTSIGSYAFSGYSSLTSVTIGKSVTSIGSYAFSGCSSLTSVTIGKSVTSIGSYAFYNCSSLTSITIPNSVTSIGSHAFSNEFSWCDSLTSITFSDTSTWYRTTNYWDWQNKSGGTETSVKDSSQNATYFTTYDDYYWYKI